MKVFDLIERLQKCDPLAEVEFAYACDNLLDDGTAITSVVQTTFITDKDEEVGKAFVTLRG